MIFAIQNDRSQCLLSRHFGHSALAGRLAAQYLDGWFRHDPLLPALMQLGSGNVSTCHVDATTSMMEPEYRRIFFEDPGLAAKTTVLAAGHTLRIFVNFYHGSRVREIDDRLIGIAGRMALLHFDRPMTSDEPPALAVLSEREKAVCLGILSGQKAEVIAAGLNVAASTVVTYRKRAYAKLGVTSRAGLFAICRG